MTGPTTHLSRFEGDADGGIRTPDNQGDDARASQITEQQLKTMTAEEIVAAQKAGRLANLLGT